MKQARHHTRSLRKKRLPWLPALQQLRAQLKSQQSQISLLSRWLMQLREEGEVLRECLEGSGALAPARFLAGLHRRQFAQVIKRHPLPWPPSLGTILQIRELALATAAHAGAASVTPLATVSRVLHSGVGCVLPELPTLFPSEVYVIGGADDSAETLGSVESFHSAHGLWKPSAPLIQARESCAVAVASGMIYVIGGIDRSSHCLATVERFDPSSPVRPQGSWEPVASMNSARSAAAAVAHNGKVYAIGGRDGFQSLHTVECLDPASLAWEMLPSLQRARFGAAAAVVGRQAYVIGGKGGGRVLDAVEAFDFISGTWEQMPSLHARRFRAAAASAHGRVYVAGGSSDGSWQSCLRSVERLDPKTRAWSRVAPLQVPRWGAAAVCAGGSVCVLGGRDGGGSLCSVERFDLSTETWEPMPRLHTSRRFFGAAAWRA